MRVGGSGDVEDFGQLGDLKDLTDAGPCELEEMESLEQLRAVALGIPIKVEVVESSGLCVDVPADIVRVEDVMSTKDQP